MPGAAEPIRTDQNRWMCCIIKRKKKELSRECGGPFFCFVSTDLIIISVFEIMYREKRGNVPGPYLFFRGAAWAQDGDFIEKGIANALRICYNPKRRKSAAEAGLSEGRRRPAEAADAAESAIAGAAESPREMKM